MLCLEYREVRYNWNIHSNILIDNNMPIDDSVSFNNNNQSAETNRGGLFDKCRTNLADTKFIQC